MATGILKPDTGAPGNTTGSARSFVVGKGYDADDRLTSLTYSDGSVVGFGYTARHQLRSVDRVPVPGVGGGAAEDIVSLYTYDAGMRETARDLGNGLTRSTGYTRSDNLPTSHTVVGQDSLTLSAYTYDANKNLISETRDGVMAKASFTVASAADLA